MAAHCPKQYLHIGGQSILQLGVQAFYSTTRSRMYSWSSVLTTPTWRMKLRADPQVIRAVLRWCDAFRLGIEWIGGDTESG